MRLWNDRSKFQNDGEELSCGTVSSITLVTKGGIKKICLKELSGRGRKRESWVDELLMSLREEFERIQELGVQFNLKRLQLLNKQILSENTSQLYSPNMLDPRSQKLLMCLTTPRWIQSFTDHFNISNRVHTVKHRGSPPHEIYIENLVSYNLGYLKRIFESKEVDENDVKTLMKHTSLSTLTTGGLLGFQETKM